MYLFLRNPGDSALGFSNSTPRRKAPSVRGPTLHHCISKPVSPSGEASHSGVPQGLSLRRRLGACHIHHRTSKHSGADGLKVPAPIKMPSAQPQASPQFWQYRYLQSLLSEGLPINPPIIPGLMQVSFVWHRETLIEKDNRSALVELMEELQVMP
ncbi:hypothetical protein NDU88_008819 [Pleurodeles waltl]|uniref:Uncharacterized protein n=1 Tax=Pleurodeles waltl TaxID=8319 RepID=A0AAV7QVV1_PLEWA|nr:hypothetical protein NDU88_008819 [Pleurodeles waltl]